MMTFVCGECGVEEVAGIYCDKCRAKIGTKDSRPIASGEKVRFLWHGVEREGIVEKVGRTHVKALVEYKEKRKILRVAIDELLGRNGVKEVMKNEEAEQG